MVTHPCLLVPINVFKKSVSAFYANLVKIGP